MSCFAKPTHLMRRLSLGLALWLALAASATAQLRLNEYVVLDGKTYTLVRFLGKGAFGEVYRAQPEGGGAPIAVKIVRDTDGIAGPKPVYERLYDDSPGSRRFIRTGRAVQAVVGRQPGRGSSEMVVTSELARSESLESLVKESLQVTPELIQSHPERAAKAIAAAHAVARDLIEGLDHLASKGLLHGDVKPENIFFMGDVDTPVTVDSIIAGTHRAVFGDLDGVARMPVLRSEGYESPDFRNLLGTGQPVSDHYSLGLTVAEILGWKLVKPRPVPTASAAFPVMVGQEIARNADALRRAAGGRLPSEAVQMLEELARYTTDGSSVSPKARLEALAAEKSTLLKPGFAERYRPRSWSSQLAGGLYDNVCGLFRMAKPGGAAGF